VSAGVVELVQLHPVETEPLGEALRHTGRLVVAAPGGAHAQPVLQAGLRDAFLYLESPMMVSEASSDAIHTAAHRSVQY
jgi:pyruvate/2-oxoglutarate/acetoin dehydrogenase E1 component